MEVHRDSKLLAYSTGVEDSARENKILIPAASKIYVAVSHWNSIQLRRHGLQ